MKRMFLALLVGAALALAAPAPEAVANDKGPQFADSTIRTNNAVVQIPIGETGRFTPQYLVLTGLPALGTSVVSYVASGHTGVVSAATTASLLTLTNIPPMFYGDYFLVVNSALTGTNTFGARVIGVVFD